MQITKIEEDGRVYARTDYGGGVIVIEKADPSIGHDAPLGVPVGTEVAITFTIRDFDGAARADSGGTITLDIAGTEVVLDVASGQASLVLELHAAVEVTQRPPYFADARLTPFRIEVTV